jgi:hypothetical protein
MPRAPEALVLLLIMTMRLEDVSELLKIKMPAPRALGRVLPVPRGKDSPIKAVAVNVQFGLFSEVIPPKST